MTKIKYVLLQVVFPRGRIHSSEYIQFSEIKYIYAYTFRHKRMISLPLFRFLQTLKYSLPWAFQSRRIRADLLKSNLYSSGSQTCCTLKSPRDLHKLGILTCHPPTTCSIGLRCDLGLSVFKAPLGDSYMQQSLGTYCSTESPVKPFKTQIPWPYTQSFFLLYLFLFCLFKRRSLEHRPL